MRLFVMLGRGLNQRLHSIYHPLSGQIFLQLADWSPILTLGIHGFLLDPSEWFFHSLCIVEVSLWELSHFIIWFICLLRAWCMIHPLSLWGVILVTFQSGNIVGIHCCIPCVVSVFLWFCGMLIQMVWLGVGLGLLGVWRWRMFVYFILLCRGWGRVILVVHLPCGSALPPYLCLVWYVIIL